MPDLIFKLAELQKEMNNYISTRFFNTQPVISLTIHKPLQNLQFLLHDIMLIGAMTCSSVLLSGSSGSGKTFLAELTSRFLYGTDGFSRKNITPDMNEQDFMDIDFGAIKDGKSLKEALLADQLFSKPALIIDEANRAPPIIQNRLMQILENNIDLKSKTIKAGPLLSNGSHYHWNILTLNYGHEYAGTSTVDKALKDRITIDIPIDNFPPTLDDQIRMIRKPDVTSTIKQGKIWKELIFEINQAFEIVNLTLEAEALLLYLSFASNCIKSPTLSKYGINFTPNYCKEKDCPYARHHPLKEICPYTFAPSNRVLRKVVKVAKGFALLKHAKIITTLEESFKGDEIQAYFKKNSNWDVSIEDVLSIAPLILHSKLSMNREWVSNKFNGNSYLAIKHFLKVINSQLNEFMRKLLPQLVKAKRGNEKLTQKEIVERKEAIKEDFHFEGLIKYVEKYLS